jgi:hypothetical protein
MAFTRHLTEVELFYDVDFISLPKSSRKRRPPTFIASTNTTLFPWHTVVKSSSTVSTMLRVLPEADICRDMPKNARILISGLLTHPLGSELALVLVQKCEISHLVGISEHLLGNEDHQRLAFLLQNIPQLTFHYKPPADSGPDSVEIVELFQQVQPTHVIHLEPTCFLKNEKITPDMIAVRNSINKLQRLCEAAIATTMQQQKRPRILYVTSSILTQNSYRQRAIQDLYPFVLKTYQNRYQMNILQLKLPFLYGPFDESAHFRKETKMIHIRDAVYLTIKCMTKRLAENTTQVLLPSYQASNTHFKSIEKIRRDPNLRSWEYQLAHPFVEKTKSDATLLNHTNMLLEKDQYTIEVSLLQRQQYQLFPCLSECASHPSCRKKSAFTETQSLLQNATKSCRFVVYTVQSSSQVKELPLIKNFTEASPNVGVPLDQLCQVAIVSPDSILVAQELQFAKRSAYGDDSFNSTKPRWNGNLIHNGWKLFWPTSDMEPADAKLLKIAPGKFFGANVTKAMYLEIQQMEKLPSLPILYFLMARQLDSKEIKPKTKLVKQPGTSVEVLTQVPGKSARHMALFSHAHFYPDLEQPFHDVQDIARFLLQQKGLPNSLLWQHRLPLQVYQLLPKIKKLSDTFLVVHNLQSQTSRRLRCEWYKEHLLWGGNKELEDLALMYVLAKQRMGNRLLPQKDELWGEEIVSESNSTSRYFIKLHPPMKVRRRY